ncbi:MAG: CPBP family intramembrane metalloprotease [Planctomycetia bacterium]|nr:CPBP family intramembrane metalloprotease [Planctomycetia bacterium]
MKWSNVKLIFLREVRDQLRDRRTLFMIAVLPVVLYPLLGMSMFQVAQFVREQPTKVLVVGRWRLPNSPELFENGRFSARWFGDQAASELLAVEFVSERDLAPDEERDADRWRSAIDLGRCDAVLYVPPDFGERLEELRIAVRDIRPEDSEAARDIQVPAPQVFYSTATEKSQLAMRRVGQAVSRWSEEVGRENLALGHLPQNSAEPFKVSEHDTATTGHRDAALWSKVLPFMLLIWALTGAFYPAIDLCAGEKERGTLETLLSSPAERIEIVWGKLLTVMLFSTATAVLNLVSLGATGAIVLRQLPRLGPPPALAPLWLLIALVPVAALFSALCLAIAAFARSTKEGQYYLMPLVLVTLPLVMIPMAPGGELTLGNSLIPVTGIVLLLRAMLEGNYAQALLYGPPVGLVTLGCCLLAIRWAVDQFNSEGVLFRESERFDLRLWLRQLLHDRESTPTVAGAVFCGVLILMLRFFMGFALPQPDTFFDLARVTLVSQLAVVATPALLMTIMLSRSPTKTLLLCPPVAGSLMAALVSLPAAVLLAAAVYPTLSWLGVIVQQLYPLSPQLKELLTRIFHERPELWKTLLIMAVVPAVCEELAFRGFILSGLRRMGHKWRAIIVSSLFFAVTHLIFQQSILTFLVGIVIGYVAVQSGSLLPCVLYHITHNSITILMSNVQSATLREHPVLRLLVRELPDEGGLVCTWSAVAVGGIVAIAILLWFRRLPSAMSPEEALQEAIAQHAEHAPTYP